MFRPLPFFIGVRYTRARRRSLFVSFISLTSIIGLALGVLTDAFLVRMTLTPALMHLLGEKAWWMPRWLKSKIVFHRAARLDDCRNTFFVCYFYAIREGEESI